MSDINPGHIRAALDDWYYSDHAPTLRGIIKDLLAEVERMRSEMEEMRRRNQMTIDRNLELLNQLGLGATE